jgi:hypothetical protein
MRHRNGTYQPGTAASRDIEELSRQLAEWRQTHKSPTRIPEELWAKAAALAGVHGICPMSRALRLDYASLRKRVQTTPHQGQAATFMEFLAPMSGNIAECALEVESNRGARLRVELKNLPPAGLASILRDFAG